MNKILCFFTAFTLLSGIYNFNLNDIDGNNFNLSQYRGKKILFVNTASKSSFTSQYASLERLYQKYKDSLIIIAIPSNSFGNESRDNAQIKQFVTNTYHIHFIVTQKTDVMGTNQSPLYKWLSHIEQNTIMSNAINDDFYKFLVDGSGKLVGAYVSSVDPMSNVIQNAISN
jgi:glutathione peroxidase